MTLESDSVRKVNISLHGTIDHRKDKKSPLKGKSKEKDFSQTIAHRPPTEEKKLKRKLSDLTKEKTAKIPSIIESSDESSLVESSEGTRYIGIGKLEKTFEKSERKTHPTDALKQEVSEFKKNKTAIINEKYPVLHEVINTAQLVSHSDEIQKSLKEFGVSELKMQHSELDVQAKVIQFRNKKKKTKHVVLLDAQYDSQLGQGSYKTYYLGIDLHKKTAGGLGIQRLNPDISHQRSIKELSDELCAEHDLGKEIQKKVGKNSIHTTKFISVIKEGSLEQVVLWSPLRAGTLAKLDPFENEENLFVLTPKQFYNLAKKLFQIVDKTHNCGYAHCDIKLENIFLDNELQPMLGDWGNAVTSEDKRFERLCRRDNQRLAGFLGDLFGRMQEKHQFPLEQYDKYDKKFQNLCAKYGVTLSKIPQEQITHDPETPTSYWNLKKTESQ